jgi:transcriptional regulator with XRE-family HTH domain
MAIRLLPKRLIGTTIRGIRTRLGQTQDEFAESLGLEDGSTVSKWENGEAQPDYGTLAKIATMGLVDVLVFTEAGPAADAPQLTPGEANELRRLLGHMETLMREAREIVERAADRTAVEVLEAATGRAPARGEFEIEPALAVHAEVAVTPRARKSAGGGARSSGRAGARSGGTSGEGGGSSTRGSKEGGGRASSSRRGGGSKSAGGGRTRSSGGRSSGGTRSSSDRSSSGGSSSGSSRSSSGGTGSSSGAAGASGEGSSTASRSSRTGSRSRSGGTGGGTSSGAGEGSSSGAGGGSSSGTRGGGGRSGSKSQAQPAD